MTYDLGVIKRQRYVPPPLVVGGTTSNYTVGGINYTIHVFTASGTFFVLAPGTIEYLVVAGGGGGGAGRGGGGGAGGLIYNSAFTITQGISYTVTVGAGGTGAGNSNGSNSTLIGTGLSVTSIGGGGGGGEPGYSPSVNGSSGGSGGAPAEGGSVGAGTVGQGYASGQSSGGNYATAGGGGAGGVGASNGNGIGGNGGVGLAYSISGTSTYYAGGGGGSTGNSTGTTPGAGGNGGGGAGSNTSGAAGTAGTVNTGGGGGGGIGTTSRGLGGAGGSGIVIIRYPTPVNSQPFNDPYFNSTALLLTGRTEAYPSVVDYIVVAGGGAGGSDVGGGGGAGGLIQVLSFAAPWQTKTYYTVTIGAGGVGNMGENTGGAGGNSSFSTTAVSGGGGGANQNRAGASGGSGGGGGWFGGNNAGGAGIAGQGNAGAPSSGAYYAGGGGGAGAASTSAEGGSGVEWPTSSGIFYAKGGGGGYSSTASQSAAANTGNGGSGAAYSTYTPGGNGGSGVVIIRYDAKSAPAITTGNPTIEVSNGYRYYTFKTSGSIQWGSDNTFRDSSYNALTVTPAGTPTQGSFSPFSQNWSTYFNGSTDYLTIPYNANIAQWYNTDYTIEMWVNSSVNTGASANNYPTQVSHGNPSTDETYWAFGTNSAGVLYFYYYNGATVTTAKSTSTIKLNAWNHIAMVYTNSSGMMKGYIDGVQVFSIAKSGTPAFSASAPISIGSVVGTKYAGYISNLRVVKGTALYTANFTPSTSPLTVISNTVLLTCASNRFLDKSGTISTFTAVGSPSVKPLAPFRGNDYNALVQGGSGFFSGTSNYLSLSYNSSFNLGTGSFTWEAWIYPTNISGIDGIYSTSGGSGANPKFVIHLNAGTPSIHYNNLTGGSDIYTAATSAVAVNTWTHLAFVRNSSTWTWYINGVSAGTGSNSTNITFTNQSTYIGYGGESYFTEFNGYISNLRMINGTAVYTSNFAPPAAPVRALNTSSSTSLLLNFTNAGIIDYTAQNNIVAVGSAALSRTVTKFNSRSIYFNGTTDYLSIPTNAALNVSTGDFTAECWFNTNSINNAGNGQTLIWLGGNTSAYAGVRLGLDVSGIAFYLSTDGSTWAVNTGPIGTVLSNTWYHVAVTRSGSSFKVFLNGTQVGTTYTQAGTLYAGTLNYIGSLNYTAVSGTPFRQMNGYIDDVRITKGVARYTANFTLPTQTLQLR